MWSSWRYPVFRFLVVEARVGRWDDGGSCCDYPTFSFLVVETRIAGHSLGGKLDGKVGGDGETLFQIRVSRFPALSGWLIDHKVSRLSRLVECC